MQLPFILHPERGAVMAEKFVTEGAFRKAVAGLRIELVSLINESAAAAEQCIIDKIPGIVHEVLESICAEADAEEAESEEDDAAQTSRLLEGAVEDAQPPVAADDSVTPTAAVSVPTPEPAPTPEPTVAAPPVELAPEPPASASVASLDIFQLAARKEASVAAHRERMSKAYRELNDGLMARGGRVKPSAVYRDRNFEQTAFLWGQIRIAKQERTVDEVIDILVEQDLTVDLAVAPTAWKQMMDAFSAEGLHLNAQDTIDGQIVDVRVKLGQAIAAGEITCGQAIELAKAQKWAAPFREQQEENGLTTLAEMEEFKRVGAADRQSPDKPVKPGKRNGKRR